jgi:hypothetical protein
MTLDTDRTRVRRKPERARYDAGTIYSILDAAPICHVGLVRDGVPVVIPTIHARIDDVLYLHASSGSGFMTTPNDGAEVCVTATIVDGLVLARSAMHHSMNYRSVVVFGRAEPVTDPGDKLLALRAVVEHVAEGRWDEVRAPNAKELAATAVVRIPIDAASAKVRTGPPVDDEDDLDLPVWAGVVPLRAQPSDPIGEPGSIPVPRSVLRLVDRSRTHP